MSEEEENNTGSLPPDPPPPPPPPPAGRAPARRVLGVQLVPDASEWRRWWSMRWIIAGAYFSGVVAAYMLLPSDWLPTIPAWVKQAHAIGALLCGGGAAASRVIQQPRP